MVDLGYYRNASPEYHKLRPITRRSVGNNVLGISLPCDKVKQFEGTWFRTEVIGTTIILYSGCKT